MHTLTHAHTQTQTHVNVRAHKRTHGVHTLAACVHTYKHDANIIINTDTIAALLHALNQTLKYTFNSLL